MINKETDIAILSKKVLQGLQKSSRMLVEAKAAKNELMVIADQDGKIKNIPAKEILHSMRKENSDKSKEQNLEAIKELFCKAINQKRLVKFYYESDKSKKKEWRTVEPYIIGIKENGNIFLAALPIEELEKNIDERITGHYLLKKIDINKIEFLSETFKEPNINRKRIVHTPHIHVICRFVYEDEL